MRMLVHYYSYGEAAKVSGLVAEHSGRIRRQIDLREEDEVGRLEAEYRPHADRLGELDAELAKARGRHGSATEKDEKVKAAAAVAKAEKQREKVAAKVSERDERIAEARRRAEDDRKDVNAVGTELIALYADPDELLKHARVVGLDEIKENEFNLNIPRYVDTFEPEPRIEVTDALEALRRAEKAAQDAEGQLRELLKGIGYAH
jgi:type I restriction enzyme M protein